MGREEQDAIEIKRWKVFDIDLTKNKIAPGSNDHVNFSGSF
jgi:hypothetical protein